MSIKHVAIIMDGNGRWAQKRFRPRIWGHVRGSSVVSEIVTAANEMNLNALTMYAFSTENWSRPVEEVSTLFKLLKKFLQKEKNRIISNNIKFKVIGDTQNLPIETVALINEIEKATLSATGLKLTFAFNYGGRAEIVRAVNSFLESSTSRHLTEADLNGFMYRPETGDVDLMIRTGGEQRISNFLLWQMAYAEFYFTQTRWPDFTACEFHKIVGYASTRERRFGNITEQLNLRSSVEMAQSHKAGFIESIDVQ